LVVPSARTSGGHRLYTSADLMLLYQVTAMRQLGLSLEQVGILLAGRTDVRRVIARPGLPAASGRRVGPARLPAT
jgi:DNA-binding transcriptional MerR regulator